MKKLFMWGLLAAVPFLLLTGCATVQPIPGTGSQNAIVKLVVSDIQMGRVQTHVKLLVQGAVLGCRLARVGNYQAEFKLVNVWATRVNGILKANTTPLTEAQMQDLTSVVGIKTSDTIALEVVAQIIATVEDSFVKAGVAPNLVYQALLQASQGAMEGTAQYVQ